MKKLLSMALAFAFASTAVPAFASVQNVKVYGNLDNTYLHRQMLDFKQSKQSNFFTQTRLGIDADLTDNVAVTFGLINERLWSADNTTSSSDVDLYLAYATIREMLYSPLTVVVGRQQWGYGNGFIFDATGRNNAAPGDTGLANVANDFTYQTSLDAIRFILDYNPLTIEGFYSLIEQESSLSTTRTRTLSDSSALWGANLTYALGDDMDSMVETYFFNLKDGTNVTSSPNNNQANLYVTGLRGSTNPVEGLNLQLEFAKQHGKDETVGARSNAGYAIQGIVNYVLPVMDEYNPVLNYTLTKLSGDSDDRGRNEAWVPFFEAQGGNTLYNSLFELTNLVIHSVSVEANPVEDLTAKLSYHGLWLTDRNGGLSMVNPYGAGTLATATGSTNNKSRVGSEIDLDLTYAYTEDVTIGTSLGYFLPSSSMFTADSNTAKQAIVKVGVAF